MIGDPNIGNHKQTTAMRFKKIAQFESYINSIDMNYGAEETTSTAYIFKLNTPNFNKFNRSKYGKRLDFKQVFLEVIGEKFYVPKSGYCIIKYIEYLTA